MIEIKYLTVTLTAAEHKRIFSKIKLNPDTGCWIWMGTKRQGRGRMTYRGIKHLVYRILFAWIKGPIPAGAKNGIYCLDHVVCHNPICVNPDHLELVTKRENTIRSDAPTAINARKTHCVNGHRLPTKPNSPQGWRRCRVCEKVRNREYQKHRTFTEEERQHRNAYGREYRKLHPYKLSKEQQARHTQIARERRRRKRLKKQLSLFTL